MLERCIIYGHSMEAQAPERHRQGAVPRQSWRSAGVRELCVLRLVNFRSGLNVCVLFADESDTQRHIVLLIMRLFCMLTRLGQIMKLARVKKDITVLVSCIVASAKSMLPISALLFICKFAMSAKGLCVWVCCGQPCPPLAESYRGERVCVRASVSVFVRAVPVQEFLFRLSCLRSARAPPDARMEAREGLVADPRLQRLCGPCAVHRHRPLSHEQLGRRVLSRWHREGPHDRLRKLTVTRS